MAFKMKGSPMQRNFGIGSALKNVGTGYYEEQHPSAAFQQTDDDLREWLLGQKRFSQEEANQMIADGAYTTSSKDFLAWYKKSKKKDDLAVDRMEATGGESPVKAKGGSKYNVGDQWFDEGYTGFASHSAESKIPQGKQKAKRKKQYRS
jgi:hypothetical protein